MSSSTRNTRTTKRKPGRPSGLTPEVQERLVSALQAGNYIDTASQYAGISTSVFYKWADRGRAERERRADGLPADADEDVYVQFVDAIESARAQAEVRAVALIQKAANDGTWQAAAWFLERSHPHRWGRLQRTEVTGAGGGPVEIDAAGLERKIAAALGESTGDGSGDV